MKDEGNVLKNNKKTNSIAWDSIGFLIELDFLAYAVNQADSEP